MKILIEISNQRGKIKHSQVFDDIVQTIKLLNVTHKTYYNSVRWFPYKINMRRRDK